MIKNMAGFDRIIRLVLVIAVAILFFTDQISGLAAIILGVFALAFLFSSLTGFCPLYKAFRISTLKK